MIIRQVTPSDIPELSLLAKKTYAETFGDGLTPDQLTSVLESTRSETYFKSAMIKDTILVAVDDMNLLGYIQISDVRYRLEGIEISENDQAIYSIYVHSEYQGQGIGSALMKAALNHPRLKTSERVFIDVYEENIRALNMYRKYGFKTVGKIDVVIDGETIGYDLVLMKKV